MFPLQKKAVVHAISILYVRPISKSTSVWSVCFYLESFSFIALLWSHFTSLLFFAVFCTCFANLIIIKLFFLLCSLPAKKKSDGIRGQHFTSESVIHQNQRSLAQWKKVLIVIYKYNFGKIFALWWLFFYFKEIHTTVMVTFTF